jgi:hypothetical protein
MVENSEVVKLPLFDEAAAILKEKGIYRKELTSEELAGIMSGIVSKLTEGQDAVKASVPSMDVKIEKAKGTVTGAVRVEKPIQATIKVNCALDNDNETNRIRLADLKIEQEACN